MKLEKLKQYNKFASKFARLHSKLDKTTNEVFYPMFVGDIKGKKLLDLGCGEGKDLLYFEKYGAKTYGIDISTDMIRLAKALSPNSVLEIGKIEKLPFKINYFDFVVSKYAFQTSRDINPIFKEVNRVLKKGGIFCFVVTHPIRQFMEKKRNKKDYFKKELVKSVLFRGELVVEEPSHTMLEYLSPYFLKNFCVVAYEERFDPSNAEKVNGDKYPAFMIIKAVKK
jgi:ubiquinone/menaquinone biosynthesis C-methylase UbiE